VSLQVRTTPEADAQIGAVDDWWRRNRLAAPDLFLEELAASFDVIGYTPQIGRLYRQSPVPGTRRVLLTGSRYHVYYVPLITEVKVLAV
jgi:plasmid stabilization system protein ParE